MDKEKRKAELELKIAKCDLERIEAFIELLPLEKEEIEENLKRISTKG